MCSIIWWRSLRFVRFLFVGRCVELVFVMYGAWLFASVPGGCCSLSILIGVLMVCVVLRGAAFIYNNVRSVRSLFFLFRVVRLALCNVERF